MKSYKLWAASALLSAFVGAAPASAQAASPLSQCLLAKAGEADRMVLVQWIFAGMARGQATKDMARVTEEQRIDSMRKAGALIQRLMLVDCRPETIAAMKSDPNSLQAAFGTLGEQAMVTLMADPAVDATFSGISEYVDIGKFAALMVEAGAAGTSAEKPKTK